MAIGETTKDRLLEWTFRQGASFVVLAFIAAWVGAVAYPDFIEFQRETVANLRNDQLLMHKTVTDLRADQQLMRGAIQKLTERLDRQNEVMAEMVRQLRER